MATIINNPNGGVEREREVIHHEDSGAGWAVALIILVLLVLFLLFGLPNLGGTGETAGDDTNNVIPDEIDVNVNTPGTNGGSVGE